MDIKCTTCGKDVTPLELYDGYWSCPNCRNLLSDFQSDFVVNADNEELFLQSELLYASWLFNRDGRASDVTVKKAVDLCKRSARMGNPKALARLAFFYEKGYIDKNYTDVMRYKIAYEYYSSICYSGLGSVEVKDDLPPVKWKELCEKTAYAMLYMLVAAPMELQATKTYSFINNLERVRNEMGIEVDLTGFDKTGSHVNIADRAFAMLCSCTNKHRAPLFCAFQIKASSLKELYERPMPGAEHKIPKAMTWLGKNKKVYLAYMRSSYIKDGSKSFTRILTTKALDTLSSEIGDNEYVWAFFFNNNGGHEYLGNKKKRQAVQKIFCGERELGSDILKMMLQNGNRNFYAFYDDDIYHFMKHANESDATRALIDKVCNGGDDA